MRNEKQKLRVVSHIVLLEHRRVVFHRLQELLFDRVQMRQIYGRIRGGVASSSSHPAAEHRWPTSD